MVCEDRRYGRRSGNEFQLARAPAAICSSSNDPCRAFWIGEAGNACYDLLVIDSPPHATTQTVEVAQAANLLLLPTGLALDDLEPSVLLAHELVKKGVQGSKILFVLSRVGDSEAELDQARAYLQEAGYEVCKGSLPERVAYRRASDGGLALTETRYTSLRMKADAVAQEIADIIKQAR